MLTPSIDGWSIASNDGGEILAELASLDTPHDMPRAVALCDARSERRFVLRRAAEFIESEGDRADLTLASVPHQAEKRTRIDTGGKKHPDLDIRKEMGADAVEHRGAQALAQFG